MAEMNLDPWVEDVKRVNDALVSSYSRVRHEALDAWHEDILGITVHGSRVVGGDDPWVVNRVEALVAAGGPSVRYIVEDASPEVVHIEGHWWADSATAEVVAPYFSEYLFELASLSC